MDERLDGYCAFCGKKGHVAVDCTALDKKANGGVEERPWGSWKVVHEEGKDIGGDGCHTVKVLTVNPGCMLSLQAHKRRTEYWLPLDDGLVAYTDARHTHGAGSGYAVYLTRCKPHKVGANERHRLINPGTRPISVVEIIIGYYDEEDITRYHDAYGR